MKTTLLLLTMILMTSCGTNTTYIPYAVSSPNPTPTPTSSCAIDITEDAMAIIQASINEQLAPIVLDSAQLAANIKDAIAKIPCTGPSIK